MLIVRTICPRPGESQHALIIKKGDVAGIRGESGLQSTRLVPSALRAGDVLDFAKTPDLRFDPTFAAVGFVPHRLLPAAWRRHGLVPAARLECVMLPWVAIAEANLGILALRRRFISLFAMSRTRAPADLQLWFLRPFPPRRAIGHWNSAVRAGEPRTRRYDRFSNVEGPSSAPSPAVGTLRNMAAALPPSPHAPPAVGPRLWRRVSRALRPCRPVRRATS